MILIIAAIFISPIFSLNSKAFGSKKCKPSLSNEFKRYFDISNSDLNIDLNYLNQSTEGLEKTIGYLKIKLEKSRNDFLANEIAVKKAQSELQHLIMNNESYNNNITKCDYDYGFVSKSAGSLNTITTNNAGGAVPASAIFLAFDNFKREFGNILNTFEIDKEKLSKDAFDEGRIKLKKLTLSNDAIWEREKQRPEIKAPIIIKIPYYILCILLDKLFDGDPISRFYFLETVARMPYFSYITMLHSYETLGWWRRSTEAKRIHFAEEYNEYHHLLIWESLGGDQEWKVRFFAQHSAIVYFFVLIGLWILSPSLAYNFSELIEAHAVDTYAEFAEANKELLQTMEAPKIAKIYYEAVDMYVFDEFQSNRVKGSRRPVINSLYDVVCNIRDDEAEHVATMAMCQDPNVIVRSPNTEAALLAATAATVLTAALLAASTSSSQEDLLTKVLNGEFDSSSFSNLDLNNIFNNVVQNVKDSASNVATTAATTATSAMTTFKESTEGLSTTTTVNEEVLKSTASSSENLVENVGEEMLKNNGLISKIMKFFNSLRF
jgi:ubiquinol oxidase